MNLEPYEDITEHSYYYRWGEYRIIPYNHYTRDVLWHVSIFLQEKYCEGLITHANNPKLAAQKAIAGYLASINSAEEV